MVRSRFTEKELESSRELNRYQLLQGPDGHAAVEAMAAKLETWEANERHDPKTGELTPRKRRRRPEDAETLRAAMSCVLANLYVLAHHRTETGMFIAVGFRNEHYPRDGLKADRYNRSPLTIGAMKDVRDYLVGADLVDFAPGFSSRHPIYETHGRLSRLRARPALVETLEGLGIGPANIGSSGMRELVVLKGPAPGRQEGKPLKPYIDNDETKGWRKTLGQVNELLARTDIGFPPGFAFEGHSHDGALSEEDPKGERAGDLTSKTLYRVFNNERWDHGGRLYGGFWESAPKDWRKAILIDGEATCELDFKALHPRLLYAKEGMDYRDDPYVVVLEGRPCDRDLGKTTFQRLINGHGGWKLRKRAGDIERLPSGVAFKEYVEALIGMHARIDHHFGTGVGLGLQRIDSDIAMDVLAKLSCDRGIPVLPVHDSFIIQARHREALRQAMVEAFGRYVDTRIEPLIDED